jgi:hypothetical protein
VPIKINLNIIRRFIMKKFSRILLVFAGLSLILGLSMMAKKGGMDDMELTEDNSFGVAHDGTVKVDGLSFTSLSNYYRSEYFQVNGKRCKVTHSSHAHEGLAHTLGSPSDCSNNQTVIKSEYNNVSTSVAVWFHILHHNGTGDIPNDQCQRQVDVLNDDYQGSGISFTLAGVDRFNSRHWHNDRKESQYKDQTGQDRDLYLNVWVNTASGYLGYAYLPDGSAGSNWDGVVLNYQACGGRNEGSAPYNQGRTLVHEVGHYFGLLHTFDGGCCNSYTCGDLIMDTNAESGPFYYCGPRTTCGTPDPTTNYMDYSEDLCMYEFTSEQENRMTCSVVNYRPGL